MALAPEGQKDHLSAIIAALFGAFAMRAKEGPHMTSPIWIRLLPIAAVMAIAQPATAEEFAPIFESGSLSGSYLAGRYASRLRDMDIAAGYFAQALRDDPNNSVLIERTFVLAFSAGDLARAEELAVPVLRIDPKHRLAHIVLGLKDFRNKRYSRAADHFRKVDASPVDELTSRLLLAWTAAAQNKFSEALTELDKLSKSDYFAVFRNFHSALVADVLGQKIRAEGFYKKAYEEAGTSYRVVQAYGTFLSRVGKKDEAEDLFDRYLETNDDQPFIRAARDDLKAGRELKPFLANAASGMAEALFSIGSWLNDEQTIDAALIYAQLSLVAKKDSEIGQVLLGDIYEDTGRHDKAIEAYDALSRQSVLREKADIEIAVNLQRLERLDEAIAKIDELLKKDTKNYDAWVTRADFLRDASRFAEAADSYTKAIATIPVVQKKHSVVYYFRGIAYERSNQWEKAEWDFRRSLELQPDQPQVLNYLGYSMVDKRLHIPEAMDLIRKAVELRPNDGYIVDSLGWAHYQIREYDEAVKHLERAVELRPDDPIINDHLGDAYWRAGRRLEARFQWQHAKDNKPEPPDLARIEKKLAEGMPPEAAAVPPTTQSDAVKTLN